MSWRRGQSDESVLCGERVLFPFDIPSTTVHGTLEHLVIPYLGGTSGEKTVIIYGDQRITFNELNTQANVLAMALRRKLESRKARNPICIGLHMGPSFSTANMAIMTFSLGPM